VPRRVRLAAAVFSILVGSAASASVASAEDGLRLTWTAPSGCPSAETVRAAALRGVDVRAAKGDVLEADAHVAHGSSTSSDTWKVQLHTRRGTSRGEREIEASTCDGLAEATAVVLGLALVAPDNDAIGPDPVPPPAPDRDTPAKEQRRTEGHGAAHALAFGASVAGDRGMLPAAAIGGALTLAWTPGRLRIEAEARRWGSQNGSVAEYGSGARFSVTSLGGRACWAALKTGRFELSPCTGADAHLVSAPGFGADTNYSRSAAWTALGGGGLGRISLTSWLAVRARAEAVIPLSRPTFIVENEGSVHRPSIVGAAGSVGLEALFL
jgi:hypothetical protein